jgi:hypothetical protein
MPDDTDHTSAPECWCEPVLYYTAPNGNEVWLHRTPDGSHPPVELLARVIAAAAFTDLED